MTNELEQFELKCPGKCPQCSARTSGDGACRPGGLAGGRFALAALAAFAVPMGLSAAAAVGIGAVLGDGVSQAQRFVAALAALVVGVVLAGLLMRRIGPAKAREAK